jgi:hypothetical protein
LFCRRRRMEMRECVACETRFPENEGRRDTKQRWFCRVCPFVVVTVLIDKPLEWGDIERRDTLLQQAFSVMRYDRFDSWLIQSPPGHADQLCLITADGATHELHGIRLFPTEPNFLLAQSKTDRLYICCVHYELRDRFRRFFTRRGAD